MNTMYVCIINIDRKCKMFVPIDPEIANVMRSGAKSWTVMKIADDICKELRKFCILDCCCFGFFTLSNDFQQQFLVSFGSAKHLLCPPAQCSFGHQPAETRVVLQLCTAMGMDGPTCLPFISISVPLGIETPMQPVLDKLGQFGCKEPICQVGMVGDRLDPHAVGSTLRFLQEALEVWPVVVCFTHGEVEGWITFLVAQCQEFHTSLTPILPRALNLSGIHLHAIHQLFGRHVLHHRT